MRPLWIPCADFLRFYLFKSSSYPPRTLLCTSPLYSCDVRLVHSKSPTPTPLFTILHSCRGFSSDLVMAKEHTVDGVGLLLSISQNIGQRTYLYFVCESPSPVVVLLPIPQSCSCRIYSRAFHRGSHLVLLLLVYVKPEERLISHYDCIDRSIANNPSNPPSPAFN